MSLYNGDLKAEDFKDIDIFLHHSKAELKSFNSAELTMHKSKLSFNNCNKMQLTASHSDLNGNKINGKLNFDYCHKDSVDIGFVSIVEGTIDHSKFKAMFIDSADLYMHKTNLDFIRISKLSVEAEHSDIRLKDVGELVLAEWTHKNNFIIEKAEHIMGYASHSDFYVKEVSASVYLNTKKGKFELESINEKAKIINLMSEHSTFLIKNNKNIKFNFNLELFKTDMFIGRYEGVMKHGEKEDHFLFTGKYNEEKHIPELKVKGFKGRVELNRNSN
jgi:hypothetical protein